jgi:hypothetical protein
VLRHFGFENLAGIDGYEPSVLEARSRGAYKEVLLGDVRNLSQYFKPGQFDACVALDVIEHLPKEDGFQLMRSMEAVARHKVVFLTPNGFLPQRHTETSDLQEHLSGWNPSEMRGRGYRVAGVLGPKCLRGEYHRLKWRPEAFWAIVSILGHFACTRWIPERAAGILCVKAPQ